MAATCIHCHKPADKRCGNVLDLSNGDRLHRGCLTPHLLMVVHAIPGSSAPARETDFFGVISPTDLSVVQTDARGDWERV